MALMARPLRPVMRRASRPTRGSAPWPHPLCSPRSARACSGISSGSPSRASPCAAHGASDAAPSPRAAFLCSSCCSKGRRTRPQSRHLRRCHRRSRPSRRRRTAPPRATQTRATTAPAARLEPLRRRLRLTSPSSFPSTPLPPSSCDYWAGVSSTYTCYALTNTFGCTCTGCARPLDPSPPPPLRPQ